MTVSQREMLDRLFAEAIALPPEQQPAFAAANCDDPEVRRELESLLVFATQPLKGVSEAILHTAASLAAPDLAGRRMGPYRLTGRIGQGGMGAVYRAVRDDDQFQKTVAIKMLRFPDGDPSVLERFRQERQILASLEHPHIARLLDGGAWIPPGGVEPQPYIVMEYVEGLPLTTYCAQEKLTVNQRLRLFRSLCDALSYAHRQLVVHRDVKPGNILVTADVAPKLLDFGVSKLLNPGMPAGAATLTATGLQAMTPDYASPEQVRGEAVSTLTDVYSLGAVLYELLTNRRPHQLATHDPLEIVREICERDVLPPGINRELDSIVLKAMHKEPARRYQSVEQFSEDIRRYLEALPIIARPETLAYRAGKFARRHWLELMAAGAVFVALVGGTGVSTWEARRADREAATARQVSGFLSNLFEAADPYRAKGTELTARELLDEGSKRIRANLQTQPAVRAEVLGPMAYAYQHLGDLASAQQLFVAQAEAYRQAGGSRSLGRSDALRQLADVERQRGDSSSAETHLREALAIQQAVLGPADARLSHSWNNLGLILQARGRVMESVDLFRRAVEISRKYPGDREDTLTLMSNLGGALVDAGDFEEAEKVLRDVLQQRQALLAEGHPQVPRSMMRLGHLLELRGAYVEAERLLRTSLASYERILPADSLDRLVDLNNLAHVLQQTLEFAAAERFYREAIAIGQRKLGETPDVALWQSNLASLLVEKGDTAGAEPLYWASLSICRKKLGTGSTREARILSGMGQLYMQVGDYDEADRDFDRALAIRRQALGPEHPDTADTLFQLALLRRRQGRLAESEQLAREVVEIDGKHPSGLASNHLLVLADLLVDQHDVRAAEPLVQRALDLRRALLPADFWQVTEAFDRLSAIRRAEVR